MSVSLIDGHIDNDTPIKDNEIIKALECCSKITFSCDGCPFKHLGYDIWVDYDELIKRIDNLVKEMVGEG